MTTGLLSAPAAVLVGHQQTRVLQAAQGRGVRGVGVHHHLHHHHHHNHCNVTVHLGAGPGPPDPQVDAGPGELGLALALHHAALGVQAEDAGGGHLAPVNPASLLDQYWS